MKKLFGKNENEEHDFWMSYTDLMSGFLVVFIIISAIAYNKLKIERDEYNRLCHVLNIENPDSLKIYIRNLEVVVDSINHSNLKNRIYDYKDIFTSTDEINVVFDSKRGSIILYHSNSNSDLFTSGRWDIKSPLKEYLDERYLLIVRKTMDIYKDNNNVELRIEGHTDPTWGDAERGSNKSFIENLSLSSNRANSVYQYILFGKALNEDERNFVKKTMISVGYSFADRAQKNNIWDNEKDASSRRIEFRILTK